MFSLALVVYNTWTDCISMEDKTLKLQIHFDFFLTNSQFACMWYIVDLTNNSNFTARLKSKCNPLWVWWLTVFNNNNSWTRISLLKKRTARPFISYLIANFEDKKPSREATKWKIDWQTYFSINRVFYRFFVPFCNKGFSIKRKVFVIC